MTLGPLRGALRRATKLLRDSGREGAFIGGLGVIVWGRPRITQDVDLLVDLPADAVAAFVELARDSGYSFDAEEAALLSEGGFLRLIDDSAPAVPLDVLVADTPLQQRALERARTIELEGDQVRVISAEDLVLLKLIAFRPKDTFDVETVVDALGESLDRGYLEQWASRLGLEARLSTVLGDDDPSE